MATLQNLTYDAPSVCPRSSDPFHIVSYYKKGALLIGHTVQCYLRQERITVRILSNQKQKLNAAFEKFKDFSFFRERYTMNKEGEMHSIFYIQVMVN